MCQKKDKVSAAAAPCETIGASFGKQGNGMVIFTINVKKIHLKIHRIIQKNQKLYFYGCDLTGWYV